jgi:four helix bundle protein
MAEFFRVEDLLVYQKLCDLHIDICQLTHSWPAEERYELASQIRRCSNSSPANLAERHSDRHVKNKIEGVNRARGEALESVHHLYVALRKGYLKKEVFDSYRQRYEECVRMLNGLERTLERQLDESLRRFPIEGSASTLNPQP